MEGSELKNDYVTKKEDYRLSMSFLQQNEASKDMDMYTFTSIISVPELPGTLGSKAACLLRAVGQFDSFEASNLVAMTSNLVARPSFLELVGC